MPLSGLKGNVGNLNAFTIQKFQVENILPENIVVCAAGIENHEEFVELVEGELGGLQRIGEHKRTRVPSKYVGGEVRTLKESNEINLALAWESVSWTNVQEVYDLLVLNTILGDPINNNNRLKRVLNEKSYFDSAKSINTNFSDSGLFGIQVSGSASKGKEILEDVITQLKKLRDPITPEELQRAKNLLTNRILFTLERQRDRLEEGARNVRTYGNVDGAYANETINRINKVTGESINKISNSLFKKTKPTFVVSGGETNHLPSYDKIASSF